MYIRIIIATNSQRVLQGSSHTLGLFMYDVQEFIEHSEALYVTAKFPKRKPMIHQSRIRRDWNLTPANTSPVISDNVTEFPAVSGPESRKCLYVYCMHIRIHANGGFVVFWARARVGIYKKQC